MTHVTHDLRSQLAEILAEADYHIQRYTISDRGEERGLTVVAVRNLGARQTGAALPVDEAEEETGA